jgi:uncharacterized membrane protein YsdA (DUF1294 family)
MNLQGSLSIARSIAFRIDRQQVKLHALKGGAYGALAGQVGLSFG